MWTPVVLPRGAGNGTTEQRDGADGVPLSGLARVVWGPVATGIPGAEIRCCRVNSLQVAASLWFGRRVRMQHHWPEAMRIPASGFGGRMAGRTGGVSGPCGGRPGCPTGSSHGSGSGERANAVSSFTGLVEGGGRRSPGDPDLHVSISRNQEASAKPGGQGRDRGPNR